MQVNRNLFADIDSNQNGTIERAELVRYIDARGASNAGYHYLGCAKTIALIGEAFAKAILEMEE